MKKIQGKTIAAVMLVTAMLAGCGQNVKNNETNTESNTEMTANSTETENVGAAETEALHTMFLGGQNGDKLFIDLNNGTLFTAPIPEDLTDASGTKLTAEDLMPGNRVDVYGDGIMLESYPGQYPGVQQMTVTEQGAAEDVEQYKEEFAWLFAEPDLSEPPQLVVEYSTSQALVSAALSGPCNYEWEAPDSADGKKNAVAICGPEILKWTGLVDIIPEEKTEMILDSEVQPESVEVYRWPASAYMKGSMDQKEAVEVEKGTDGRFVIKDVEAGYIYGVFASWEQGNAEYGFVTDKLAE